MKRSLLIIVAGLALGAASRAAQARETTNYSSRTALIGSSGAKAVSSAPTVAPQDQSTKFSLLGIHRGAFPAGSQPVSVALYSTRVAILAAGTTEINLAPM